MKSSYSSGSNNSRGGDDYDKKLASPLDRGGLLSNISSRNLIIWFFLIISMLYILYSSNLLLNNDLQDCTTTHSSKKESSEQQQQQPLLPLDTTTTNNNNKSTNNAMMLQENQQQQQQQQQQQPRLQQREQEEQHPRLQQQEQEEQQPRHQQQEHPHLQQQEQEEQQPRQQQQQQQEHHHLQQHHHQQQEHHHQRQEEETQQQEKKAAIELRRQEEEEPKETKEPELEVKHIIFNIAGSSNLWDQRKQYIKLWWRPKETRGIVWLDQKVKTRKNEGLPEIRISGNTSHFPYTHGTGSRAALRITRVVSEALRSGVKDVRWFVMGDDDTVFVVDNVVRVLSKYDHRQPYYVGSPSESHVQNIIFSYNMAFGGGGFAISYPLAKELEKMQDRCITRYPGLYGSDDRIHACMSELGVPLTKEGGFHQYDVYGNLLGLLGAHPVAPLVSMHHLDVVDPIFPQMTRAKALQHLFQQSIKYDSASVMQQSICYDKTQMWSISVSWGFAVQIIRGVISPRELEMPTRTFLNWYQRGDYTSYAFNTRPVTKHPCQKPFVFYMRSVRYDRANKQTLGVYARHTEVPPPCRWKMTSPETIDSIVILKKPDPLRWKKSPRRDCCRVLPSKKSSTMYLSVGNCREGEVSEL